MSSPATKMAETPGARRSNQGIEIDQSTYEKIARLAYFYWEARGRPCGAPEADWFRAEEEIRRQTKSDRLDIVDEASEESFPASDAPAY